MSALNQTGNGQNVGSVIVLDSSFTNTPVAVKTAHDTVPNPPSAGSLVLENVALSNVNVAVQGGNGATILAGGSTTINAWGQGHAYFPDGNRNYLGNYGANGRGNLAPGGKYLEQVKPTYATYSTSQVLSARTLGAKGDGVTDDTAAVQKLLNQAASAGQIAFFDAGTYKVTNTIYMPPNSRVVGESYSVIMSAGSTFNNINNPVPVVQVGRSGDSGLIQWQEMIVSTQGAQAGAVLIEWNMAASSGSGMWDVHTRIGGFAGSNLQVAQCPTSAAPGPNCYAAFASMHVTASATNIYLENNWLWTADHDIDSSSNTQISVYTGRGLLYESTNGPAWLYGTGVEHHSLYQYQFANTQNVVMGFIQTETPYYQPNPNAQNSPYPRISSWNDPDYSKICTLGGNCDALALRILNSHGLYIYGAGLYSFFDNYSTACIPGLTCQSEIFDIENSSGIYVYALSTIGTSCMIYRDGKCIANAVDNIDTFAETIAMYQSG
jgi:glucan 1,3-beta-glucosidase